MNAQTHFAYLAADLFARRSALSHESREDCSTSFLETEFQKAGGLEKLTALCQDSPALIMKRAKDFVLNYARSERRLLDHAAGWPLVR